MFVRRISLFKKGYLNSFLPDLFDRLSPEGDSIHSVIVMEIAHLQVIHVRRLELLKRERGVDRM